MSTSELPKINPDEFSRYEARRQMTDHGKDLSPIQKMDAVIKDHIYQAIWKDEALRTVEYYEIEVHVQNGMVYLNGHIVSATSLSRIENAMQNIPGILGIRNNLVLDDRLTLEVAAALADLEHTYGCKFFTGVSHGVVSLNGTVSNEKEKLLAEKCAASNSNVRGVINNLCILSARLALHDQPFLQPVIGENIYFLDGISAVVKQVIINPNNRRVIAMIVQGRFADAQEALNSLADGKTQRPQQLVLLRMSTVRYLTRVSGFLNIHSNERKLYMDFDPDYFMMPNKDWTPPYPYCREDVLFPIEYQNEDMQIEYEPQQHLFAAVLENKLLKQQLLANDSLGG